jgi:hypothetical protein
MKIARIAALGASLAMTGGLIAAATGATGAYFSDTVNGDATGTIGSIQISPTNGAASLALAFTNLLPGTPQTVSVAYTNTGTSAEDVYVVFPDDIALSALNNLGRYGTVHLTSSGAGAVGDVFDSNNLNDNITTCGTFSQSPTGSVPGCWPIPNQLLVASNVAPGSAGTFAFSFMYASALSNQGPNPGTGVWNTFPVSGQTHTSNSNPSQATSGSGLPYEIVATQPGITPGAAGTLP